MRGKAARISRSVVSSAISRRADMTIRWRKRRSESMQVQVRAPVPVKLPAKKKPPHFAAMARGTPVYRGYLSSFRALLAADAHRAHRCRGSLGRQERGHGGQRLFVFAAGHLVQVAVALHRQAIDELRLRGGLLLESGDLILKRREPLALPIDDRLRLLAGDRRVSQ